MQKPIDFLPEHCLPKHSAGWFLLVSLVLLRVSSCGKGVFPCRCAFRRGGGVQNLGFYNFYNFIVNGAI